ncbi:MAG TPA: glutamate--tRNA ligase [Bacteroidia bacterium]|nr:glutamate--tRNA ligase [Bacteroidia bacterium]HRS59632.1 glutamate--tRNA ligase [Bacteroidia bacterium]HRU68987.1 glutamate--tRNA ligase [Bacteroidia bacterium]
MKEVRVRFAPSPTGPLHIGGIRTALFNYLYARKNNGTFILRIEDTDQTRYVPGAEDYILESLEWLNLSFDEGPVKGGPFAPYRQSERRLIYRQYAEKLIENDFAYYAFDTPEELENKRKEAEQQGHVFKYDQKTRLTLKNSLVLSVEETKKLIDNQVPYVVRIKTPENIVIHFHDIIRGEVSFHSSEIDDKVLLKADGLPTYHLANVVDDYLMKISHVIRGEEWLSSTPLHVLLYEFLGWKDEIPQFAHLPLILKPNGKGKLSKRDGDTGGFPVFPLQWKDPFTGEVSSGYRESGYLPEAVINMLALLGWNPGGDREIFSLQELTGIFDLDRVGKSGSKFDPEKAKWFNHHYIQIIDNHLLINILKNELLKRNLYYDEKKLDKIISLIKDRIHFTTEIFQHCWYFFSAPESYDEEFRAKRWKENTADIIRSLLDFLRNIESFTAENLGVEVKEFIQQKGYNMGEVMNPLRLCLIGSPSGIHLFDLMEVIGKEETIKRIEQGLINLS